MHWPLLWCKTGVLSDREIKKLFGEKIFIWPFKESNLKGATYNLTASCIARCAETKKSLVNQKKEIIISPGTTALIETNESIYVDRDICGTYHSKVKLVSKGLTHISTTLDPCYFGPSLIAISNVSNKVQKIKVGDTFVSLMLIKIPKSSRLRHDNIAARTDIIHLDFSEDDFEFISKHEHKDRLLAEIEEWKEQEWRIEKEHLIQIVRKNLDKMRKKHVKSILEIMCKIVVPLVILICFILYILNGNYYTDKADDGATFKYIASIGAVCVAFASKVGELIFSIIQTILDKDDEL